MPNSHRSARRALAVTVALGACLAPLVDSTAANANPTQSITQDPDYVCHRSPDPPGLGPRPCLPPPFAVLEPFL
jgi:hypothetical protein